MNTLIISTFSCTFEEFKNDVTRRHKNWLNTPARDGSKHNESSMRTVDIPPYKPRQQNLQWDFSEYKNRWDLIESKLKY